MTFSIDPLPAAFFKVPLESALKSFRATKATKAALFDAALAQLLKSEAHGTAIRRMETALYGMKWSWPAGRRQLIKEGCDVDSRDLLGLLYSFATNAAHQLHRRGQIRSLLSHMPHMLVEVGGWGSAGDTDTAPCGMRSGTVVTPDREILQQMPPCGRLRCDCHWVCVHPKDVSGNRGTK